MSPDKLRIKPESKYRPFKDAEECWSEMQKHQPFGWVRTHFGTYRFIYYVNNNQVRIEDQRWACENLFEAKFTFADGTPFGIKD